MPEYIRAIKFESKITQQEHYRYLAEAALRHGDHVVLQVDGPLLAKLAHSVIQLQADVKMDALPAGPHRMSTTVILAANKRVLSFELNNQRKPIFSTELNLSLESSKMTRIITTLYIPSLIDHRLEAVIKSIVLHLNLNTTVLPTTSLARRIKSFVDVDLEHQRLKGELSWDADGNPRRKVSGEAELTTTSSPPALATLKWVTPQPPLMICFSWRCKTTCNIGFIHRWFWFFFFGNSKCYNHQSHQYCLLKYSALYQIFSCIICIFLRQLSLFVWSLLLLLLYTCSNLITPLSLQWECNLQGRSLLLPDPGDGGRPQWYVPWPEQLQYQGDQTLPPHYRPGRHLQRPPPRSQHYSRHSYNIHWPGEQGVQIHKYRGLEKNWQSLYLRPWFSVQLQVTWRTGKFPEHIG